MKLMIARYLFGKETILIQIITLEILTGAMVWMAPFQ
jgi:hypothetical protein